MLKQKIENIDKEIEKLLIDFTKNSEHTIDRKN